MIITYIISHIEVQQQVDSLGLNWGVSEEHTVFPSEPTEIPNEKELFSMLTRKSGVTLWKLPCVAMVAKNWREIPKEPTSFRWSHPAKHLKSRF